MEHTPKQTKEEEACITEEFFCITLDKIQWFCSQNVLDHFRMFGSVVLERNAGVHKHQLNQFSVEQKALRVVLEYVAFLIYNIYIFF